MVSSTAIPKAMVNIIEVDMLIDVPIKPIKPPIIANGITFGIMESNAIRIDLNMKPINSAINKNTNFTCVYN